MNILDVCERALFEEIEDDHILLAQTRSELMRPINQDYYKFLLEMVGFKYDLIEQKANIIRKEKPIESSVIEWRKNVKPTERTNTDYKGAAAVAQAKT